MRTPLEVLSGGERGRLMLARALAKPSNLLVLDEPTNDLDLETLDVLEEMLGDYEGTVILISHDRDFLDRVVTSVIVPEGNGVWTEYAGGYSDMLKQRGADLKRHAAKTAADDRKEAGKGAKANASSGNSKRKLNFNEKHRAGHAAENHRQTAGRNRQASTLPRRSQFVQKGSPRNSILLPLRSRRRRRNCRRPRTNGWSSKCCAKRSRALEG